MPLKRKQIYLDPASDKSLKKLSRVTRLSEAEHIRRALVQYLERIRPASSAEDEDPLLRLIGVCKTAPKQLDAALNHDKYLYKLDP